MIALARFTLWFSCRRYRMIVLLILGHRLEQARHAAAFRG
jgi:hypothetical protein